MLRPRPCARSLSALALLVGALGCGAGRSEMPENLPPTPLAGRVESTRDAGAGASTEARAEAEAQRTLHDVARIRELAARGPVNAETLAQDAMVSLVREQLDREVPQPAIDASADMLFGFGIVGADFDLKQSLLDLMTAELAGFYDPVKKTLFLSESLQGPERVATLSHELVHALQDQHYNLRSLIAYREDASDAQTALHALAEGDATSAMMDYMLQSRGMRATDLPEEGILLQAQGVMAADPKAARVPGIIKRSVIASYADGLPFVHWARRAGGWAAVDAAWKSPPVSTEQLLHPEKYVRREPPLVVPVPVAPPGSSAAPVYRDVQGEQALRLLLEEWVPMKVARDAANGWGGDRLAVYTKDGQSRVAWHVRYDDAAAAERGFQALARGVLRQGEPPQPGATPSWVPAVEGERAAKRGNVCQPRHSRGIFAAVRQGPGIAVVAGPFKRRGQVSATDARQGDCASALRWAASIVAQR
jgi:hypothetical protein